jgi:nicotinate phosphoribosyltransferase
MSSRSSAGTCGNRIADEQKLIPTRPKSRNRSTSMTQTDRVSPALLTDLYQLTMAYGYWKEGLREKEAVFHVTFRHQPFGSGYTIACGLEDAIDYIHNFRFYPDDLQYLAGLKDADDKPLFAPAFLDYLGGLEFGCDVDAVPEGTVVFPHEPLLRINGPLLQCQLVETTLLNIINFQTLIATKSARICLAAQGAPVLEFGLRRAHGPDGGLAASRAAYIGGCTGTSNVLAGKVFGIPVKGTHAHSWVMTFNTELEAFAAFAKAMPANSIFLVDTYDTHQGIRHAIEVAKDLRKNGHQFLGIRLDSGDLALLSIVARRLLDDAGFSDAKILASNDLDEHIISSLYQQGARIDMWGVGTKLVTAFDQPALGGVFKLGAIRDRGGKWEYKIKLSEQAVKVSNPGMLQVRRFERGGEYFADMLYDEAAPAPRSSTIVDLADVTIRRKIPKDARGQDLLVPIFRTGKLVYDRPAINDVRKNAAAQLGKFYSGIKRLLNPHIYPVGLENTLHELKAKLIEAHRREAELAES